jgi:murein endopeptidase
MIRKLLTILSLAIVISSCGKNDDHPTDIPTQPQYQDTTHWYITDRNADVDIFYIISDIKEYTGNYIRNDRTKSVTSICPYMKHTIHYYIRLCVPTCLIAASANSTTKPSSSLYL